MVGGTELLDCLLSKCPVSKCGTWRGLHWVSVVRDHHIVTMEKDQNEEERKQPMSQEWNTSDFEGLIVEEDPL